MSMILKCTEFLFKNDLLGKQHGLVIGSNAFHPNPRNEFYLWQAWVSPVSSEAMFRAKHDKTGVSESRKRQLEQIKNKFLTKDKSIRIILKRYSIIMNS